ncbi:TetR family transcriptional regulator [Ferrovibrio sp.]|uniref:TetR family transcriptional regulator n=1 Tax=Ferrovibrio sp. TaxID=1917215 RepID=UPI003D0D823A
MTVQKKQVRQRRKTRSVGKRDAARTRQQILDAAIEEFSRHGFSGARVDAIVARAKCNMRMIYHHFRDKEGLYVAALEAVYEEIRTAEQQLDLEHMKPAEAMQRLVEFTVDHFAAHPHFVRLTSTENLHKGKFIKVSKRIPVLSSPLIETMRQLLHRGEADGIFCSGTDPLQLYVTIVALSCHHLNNGYTLSATFEADIRSAAWQAARKLHVSQFVMAGLKAR